MRKNYIKPTCIVAVPHIEVVLQQATKWGVDNAASDGSYSSRNKGFGSTGVQNYSSGGISQDANDRGFGSDSPWESLW